MALNQNMINDDADLRDGDELAFFPPVTGLKCMYEYSKRT